jgi:hypothetical protein
VKLIEDEKSLTKFRRVSSTDCAGVYVAPVLQTRRKNPLHPPIWAIHANKSRIWTAQINFVPEILCISGPTGLLSFRKPASFRRHVCVFSRPTLQQVETQLALQP